MMLQTVIAIKKATKNTLRFCTIELIGSFYRQVIL
jgi:hypothetical protein